MPARKVAAQKSVAAKRGSATRVRVAVLGATGAVGQAFVRLLDDHPWFDLVEVGASERSVGKRYREAAHWLEGDLPPSIAALTVLPCDPASVRAPLIFSALDSSVAGEIEVAFARDGRVVCSNARNHRMERDVPLLVPEMNAQHVDVIPAQRERCGWSGAIVTNANCASTVAALALAPLHERFGVTQLFVATMQAVSGAGYPGVPSLDILANVIPFIPDEEGKIEVEVAKLLGTVVDGAIQSASLRVTAHANRVPVINGHTICMSVGFDQRATPAEVTDAISSWTGNEEARLLPSHPPRPLVLTDAPNRPQPRLDVASGAGMTVTVGRVRPDALLDVRMVAMGSNTIRGAAGGAVLNAELLVQRGILDRA